MPQLIFNHFSTRRFTSVFLCFAFTSCKAIYSHQLRHLYSLDFMSVIATILFITAKRLESQDVTQIDHKPLNYLEFTAIIRSKVRLVAVTLFRPSLS